MSYTRTYEFPEEKIAGNVLIRISVIFTITGTGVDATVNSENYDLNLVNLGEITWEYNMEDFLIVPGRMGLEFFDRQNIFGGHLLEDIDFIEPTKVKFETKRGNAAWSTEFLGSIVEETIERDPYSKVISFEVMPETEILTKTRIFDFDNTTPLAPLGYSSGDKNIKTLLEDIYKVVNPSVTLHFAHDWLIAGLKDSDNTVRAEDVNLEDLNIDTSIFFTTVADGFTNLKEVLIALAREFYCFTGMIDTNTAFFRKIDNKATAEIQTVLASNIITQRKFVKFNTIKYAYVQMLGDSGIGDELPSHDEFTKLEGEYIGIIFLMNWAMVLNTTIGNGNFDYLGNTYIFTEVKDVDLIGSSYMSNAEALLQLWYQRRSNKILNTALEVELKGTDYSILKTISLEGVLYQPISLRKDFINNKSTFELLRI